MIPLMLPASCTVEAIDCNDTGAVVVGYPDYTAWIVLTLAVVAMIGAVAWIVRRRRHHRR